MNNIASIEVATNGYLVRRYSDHADVQMSVYISVVDALKDVAQHVCYEDLAIEPKQALGKSEVQK